MTSGPGLAHVQLTRVEGEGARRVFRGFLTSTPTIGSSLVIVRDDGLRLMTSPVLRVLSDADGRYWVETANSVYCLVIAATPAADEPSSAGA
jgi:hypothetical protein